MSTFVALSCAYVELLLGRFREPPLRVIVSTLVLQDSAFMSRFDNEREV